ncbi:MULTISPECIES: hypothetical protein [Alteromonas]|jgi:hypothetical protein|uniref:Uncharacterized protein n=1 Tax=Alteromonas stellipolaris TaxID=233316 RepID=A0AAW7Z2D1_9ALTE|nr:MULTISPECIES: hypothetical protein [Alteromonas]AMJ90962.1 hypothetical protein AV940_11065 [Alteromonas sp. Mac2]AMJ87099.1 hypothetical protein AV939_11295 [Alteromonas sp. Mac1]MDO6536901.1 hypothetical protein [Alteromonas stellipolaris]MDO6577091.1 hypothetical protein [Alteromonas stellipolaris]MDO6628270.1 hypothetical protein [Alteromonas stellipolaris]
MKKFGSVALIFLIVLALLIKTVGTFTLCGGTLLQNWIGVGACSNSQNQFIGFGNFRMEGEDLAGVVFLFVALVVLGLTYKLIVSKRGK